MIKRHFALALIAVVLVSGCKKDGASSAPDAAPASPSPAALPSGAATGSPVRPTAAKAAACPTGGPGVGATAQDTKDGVALTITGPEGAASDDIRARAHALAQLAGQAGGGRGGGGGDGNGPGDGTGGGGAGGAGGGGGLGRCPIVTRGTSIDVQDTTTGAVVTMRPNSPRDLDYLRKQVRSRLAGD